LHSRDTTTKFYPSCYPVLLMKVALTSLLSACICSQGLPSTPKALGDLSSSGKAKSSELHLVRKMSTSDPADVEQLDPHATASLTAAAFAPPRGALHRQATEHQKGSSNKSLAGQSWWFWPTESSNPPINDNDFQTEFLSTYGILTSTSVHPLDPESDTTDLTTWDYHEIVSELERDEVLTTTKVNASFYLRGMSLQEKPSVYVIGSALADFREKVLPFVEKPFVLVTGNAVKTMPGANFKDSDDFKRFIENERIRHWFAQNGDAEHPKFTQIPVGLNYHTLYLKVGPDAKFRWGGHATPQEQEADLKRIVSSAKAWVDRKPRVFACFRPAPGRDEVMADVKGAAIVDWADPNLPRHLFWQQVSEYQFVLSPPGYGLDSHRIWEALILGAIPIIGSTPLDSLWKSNKLPVYVTKNLTALRDWTADTAREAGLAVRTLALQNPPALKLSYWKDLFQKQF